jgi:hypothetical protein
MKVVQVKVCTACGVEKPLTEFYLNSNGLGGRLSTCKPCCIAKEKTRMLDPVIHAQKLKKDRERRERNVKYLREYVMGYLKMHPCVDCGEDDWVVLEFDHVRGEKNYDIAYILSHSRTLDNLLEEIPKCDVRCRNCHARVTYERSGSWRLTRLY